MDAPLHGIRAVNETQSVAYLLVRGGGGGRMVSSTIEQHRQQLACLE